MIPIPPFIDPEAWEGFCEMRGSKKSRPFTQRAAKMVLAELYKLRDAGHDPNACLDQSTMHGWSDVYPLKDKPIPKAKTATPINPALDEIKAREQRMSDPEEAARAAEARRLVMSKIRRVA